MRRALAVALLAAVLFTAGPVAAQTFGDWKVTDDGIATKNDSGGMLVLVTGQAVMVDKRRCDSGETYTVVVNPGDDKTWVAELICQGLYNEGPYSLYEFKEMSTFVTLLLTSKRPLVAIAMPLNEPGFVQVTFSLRGLRDAATKWVGSTTTPTSTEDKRL